MKISTKGRYGLRILLDLALHESSSPRMLRDIAEAQQIPEKYLSVLILELRNAGLTKSVRGIKGGYCLARQPRYITLMDILEIMEKPTHLLECLEEEPKSECARLAECPTREIWQAIDLEVHGSLNRITLQEVLLRHLELQRGTETSEYLI